MGNGSWFNPPSNTQSGFAKDRSGLLVPAAEVRKFHENDDVDSDSNAHHHTLGLGPNQAAPGNHAHPFARGRLAANQVIGGGTVPLNMTLTHDASKLMFLSGTNFTFNYTGEYEIDCVVTFDHNPTGFRQAAVTQTFVGQIYVGQQQAVPTAGYGTHVSLQFIHGFRAGDSIAFNGAQGSGGNLTVVKEGGFNLYTYFSIKKLT